MEEQKPKEKVVVAPDSNSPSPPLPQPQVASPSVVNVAPPQSAPTPVVNVSVPASAPSYSNTQPRSSGFNKDIVVQRVGSAIGILFGVIETSLAMRLIFKLLGANPGNVFISGLYRLTANFVSPFVGIFNLDLQFGKFVFDVPTIIALIVYSLVGYGVFWLVRLF